jgi:hypothetical protein
VVGLVMSFIHSFVAKAEVALPRYINVLNFLSIMLLAVALLLPITSSLIVLVISMLIQAAFFRVMYRKKAGIDKLLKRVGFILISSGTVFIILFQNKLL